MSIFSKTEAMTRMLRAADAVQKNELGKQDVLEQIAAMQAEGLSILRASIEDELEHSKAGALWMTTGQCAKYFGVSKNSFTNWLAPLVIQKKVRTMTPQGVTGGQSWTRYSIADLERELVDKV